LSCYYTPACFAVHKNNTSLKSPADLAGKRIGVCSGSSYEAYLEGKYNPPEGFERKYPPPASPNIRPYATDSDALEDLALGDGVRLDAIMIALPIVHLASAKGKPLRVLGDPAFLEPNAFALDRMRSGPSDVMLAKLNGIIARMHFEEAKQVCTCGRALRGHSMKWFMVDLSDRAAFAPTVGEGQKTP